MLSQQIKDIILSLQSGGQSSPLLVSDVIIAEICTTLLHIEVSELDELASRGVTDLLYYDCADRDARHHSVESIRDHSQRLYHGPSGDVLVSIFRHIDALTPNAANALLRVFEDVPQRVLILITSQSPQMILATLRSRIIQMSHTIAITSENPLQSVIDDYLAGDPSGILELTLSSGKESKFGTEDALDFVRGLQKALKHGKLPLKHAGKLAQTLIYLETSNTPAKYLIDQLIISLTCE